jgi:uncharacterized protein with GYD domain
LYREHQRRNLSVRRRPASGNFAAQSFGARFPRHGADLWPKRIKGSAATMASYIALLKFTDQGIRSVKDSPKRFAAATKFAKSFGVTIKQGFWTMGQYDLVIVADGTEEAIASWMFKVGSLGNVTSNTLRAFTADEMKKIVAKIS